MKRRIIGDSIVAILIDLKRTDFEYDVWTLVREFCPETEVFTNTTDKLAEDDYIENLIIIKFDEVKSKITVEILGEEDAMQHRCTDINDCKIKIIIRFTLLNKEFL